MMRVIKLAFAALVSVLALGGTAHAAATVELTSSSAGRLPSALRPVRNPGTGRPKVHAL